MDQQSGRQGSGKHPRWTAINKSTNNEDRLSDLWKAPSILTFTLKVSAGKER